MNRRLISKRMGGYMCKIREEWQQDQNEYDMISSYGIL